MLIADGLQVEFPEARIYEETLNVLLYENRDSRPDDELMQATSRTTASSLSDDDDDSGVGRGISENIGKFRRK